ncbi:MAG TPA: hypothetical protein VK508_00655 [Cyclobacteriaceae bacterium]|nr:hypothetical protein [Cyclobacteriaceae bacterium]
MKRLNEERLRKFPGMEDLSDEQAQKIIADLHALSIMLIQKLLKSDSQFNGSRSEFIEPEYPDNQRLKSENK